MNRGRGKIEINYFKHKKALVSPKAKIGEGTRIWAFANILDGAMIGKYCNVADGCFVEKGAKVGNHVTLKNNIAVWDGVTIADDVFVGPNAVFTNDLYPRSHRLDEWTLAKTLVKKGATIGANATIVCGITIGEYAVIGAGSVVTKDVAPFTMVVGNPARFKSSVCRCGRPVGKNLKCTCGL